MQQNALGAHCPLDVCTTHSTKDIWAILCQARHPQGTGKDSLVGHWYQSVTALAQRLLAAQASHKCVISQVSGSPRATLLSPCS